jgi:hypothetical protein
MNILKVFGFISAVFVAKFFFLCRLVMFFLAIVQETNGKRQKGTDRGEQTEGNR